MTATKKSRKAAESIVAIRSNHNTYGSNSIYAAKRTLWRTDDGRWFFDGSRGPAMATDTRRRYIERPEAVEFVATEALDPVTGYGYTREQAEQMVDGVEGGEGWRRD